MSRSRFRTRVKWWLQRRICSVVGHKRRLSPSTGTIICSRCGDTDDFTRWELETWVTDEAAKGEQA